jgi:plastocyanin
MNRRKLSILLLVACWFISWDGLVVVDASIQSRGHASIAAGVGLPLSHSGDDDHGGAGSAGGGDARGGWAHFVRWVGHFHPSMTVFPIAMLIGAALAELLWMAKGAAWLDGAARWCVIVGAAGAVITAPLGWAFATTMGPRGTWLLETHRWLGTAAAVAAVGVLVLSETSRRRPDRVGWRRRYRAALFVTVAVVAAAGYFGGAMVYGLHAYDWNPPAHAARSGGQDDDAGHSAQSGVRPAGGEAGVVEVRMSDDAAFAPASLRIRAGATVRWTNASSDVHTVTTDPKAASEAKDVAIPAGARPFSSGDIQPGKAFEQKFTVPGTYRYVCEPHEGMGMKGEIVVTPAAQ